MRQTQPSNDSIRFTNYDFYEKSQLFESTLPNYQFTIRFVLYFPTNDSIEIVIQLGH